MKDDEDPGRPLEGQPNPEKKPNGGCGGCLFPLIILALTVYCSVDFDDFYFSPGEADLWTDAMEITFENLDRVTPDSLFIDDPLDAWKHSEHYENIYNVSYVLHPFVKLRSKENSENAYLMHVISIVRHTGPNEFTMREIELDTLVAIPKRIP